MRTYYPNTYTLYSNSYLEALPGWKTEDKKYTYKYSNKLCNKKIQLRPNRAPPCEALPAGKAPQSEEV